MKQESSGNCSQFQMVIEPAVEEETSERRRFRKLLQDAVEEGLSTLGETPKHAVYYHLRETFNIRRQDIPDKMYEFADAIEKMFGEGARLLEIQIMKSLHAKTGDRLRHYNKKEGLAFTEYLLAYETI